MKIITNEKRKKINRRIAQGSTLGGLLILVAGMVISIRMPEQVTLSFAALILGFILSQVGMYTTNKWGRKPSADQIINLALKGLDNKYYISHYFPPTNHILVGPAGIWILFPYHLGGTIIYSKGKWVQRGGNTYLKLFGQENIGRPDLEIPHELEKIKKDLAIKIGTDTLPAVQAALVFTHPKVMVDVTEDSGAPARSVHVDKLKDFIRKEAKHKPFSLEKSEEIGKILTSFESPKTNPE